MTRHNLHHIRAQIGQFEAARVANGGVNSSHFDLMIAMEFQADRDLVDNPERYTWLIAYRHKLLVHLSVLGRGTLDPSPSNCQLVNYTARELVRFLNQVISPSHPILAASLRSTLDWID